MSIKVPINQNIIVDLQIFYVNLTLNAIHFIILFGNSKQQIFYKGVPMNTKHTRKISEEKVWLKYYSKEAQNSSIPKCKAYDYILECNKDRMDEPALHYYGTDFSVHEFQCNVEKCAKAFTALGVKSGDIVSFVSASIPETIFSIYALNKLGAAANAIDPRMDHSSIKRMVLGSHSRILVVLDLVFDKVKPIIDELYQDKIIVQSAANSLPFIKKTLFKWKTKCDVAYSEMVISWNDFIKGGTPYTAIEAPYVGDAMVAITYTGGTTGRPKGVIITNNSMNAVALSFIHSSIYRQDSDRFLGIIPVFAAYGLVCGVHMPLCMRTTLVPIPRFIPAQIGKLVKTFRPQHMISTPVFIELLIGSKEVQNMDLSFLYTLASGGDSMNEGLLHKLNEFRISHNMRFPLAQGYGMSELSAAASFCANNVYKAGSVGIPSLHIDMGIFDPETGEELSYYQNGEVCVTGPSMMKGYFNNPEETAIVMRKHKDGRIWIHSGDLGYMDEDGFLFIKGRIKRMITRFDGHKVFPINLENLITSRPEVRNCAVIGVNDVEHSQGQYPLAIAEFMPAVDIPAACSEIFKFCDENVEERGKPVAILPIDKLPLTGMGKIDYRTLEKKFAEYNYSNWKPKA